MSESDLNEFLDEIQGYIENTPNLSILIKKRYDECSKSYIHSSKFEDFLHITRAKIDSDNSRVFVHLRDFLNELKSNKAEKKASKKRKRRESGSNNSSGAPSPKSIRDNSTDQDTDGSVVENDEAFREVLHNQQPNSVSKPSLNHQTPKREAAETKIVESNTDSSRSIENRDCESLSQKGSNEVSDTEEVINQESNMETDINQESNVETDINQESIVETDRNQQSNVETDRNQESNVETHRNQESNMATHRNQESNLETDRNQESLGITSVKEEASAISDGDGGLCMTVKDECVDIDPQSKIENVDKSKENSDVNGGFVSDSNIDCITIDDDDDDDNQNDDDKLVIKEPTKEMKTEDICELHKEKDVIDSPKTLKCEHSNDENDQGGKTSCTLKEKEKDNSVEVESKAEICDAEVESKAEICEAEVESKAEICDAEVKSKAEICDAEVESKTEILDAVVESKAEFCDDAVESKAEIPDAVVESKAEICDEDEKKSVNKTSETVREDLAKGKNYVETKQIENQQTYSSSKFAEVGQEDNKNETAHTVTDEGTSSKSTLPLANESSEPNKKGSQRQIRRLENLLEDIRNKIEELKNADLSLDALGDEDSVYIQEDRYQHKFVKVWRKLCELKGAESTTGRPIERRFFYKGTRYPEVNRKLEKFVNKHKIFPDFHDVQKVIRDTSKQKKLGLSGPAVDRLAREAFQDIGDLLQKRRISDLRKTSLGHLQDEQGLREDPASKDPDLKKKLDENRKVGKGKLDEVLEKFCKWQEETPEDENVDKKSEEDEEDKEEMEMFVKDDVPEMIAILNDSDEETSSSPVKATTDGSSSSVSFLSDNVSPRQLSSPASVLRCKDMMAVSPRSSPCSSQVSRKLSSSSLSSDSSPNPESPYVANSPPDSPADDGEISDHHLQKKSGTLLSIEDYMDHMPVLPKVPISSDLTNDKSPSDDYSLKISNIRSISGGNSSGEEGEVTSVNSHKKGVKRHLKMPIENSTSGFTKHRNRERSPLSDSNISDGCGGKLNSSKVSNPSSSHVQRSIMFRNSRKNLSLKPLNRGTTVIDLANEDEILSKPMPQRKKQRMASCSPEEVIIVLSDSD